MGELANYSIETDHIVLLAFKDGRKLRVPLGQISSYLRPADLEKIKRAVSLRRRFLRFHMPRFFVALLAAGGLLALMAMGGKAVAGLFGPKPAPPAPPGSTGISRSQLEPTPEISSDDPAATASRLVAAVREQAMAARHRLDLRAPQVTAPSAGDLLPTAPVAGQILPPSTPVPTLAPAPSAPPAAVPSPSPAPSPQGVAPAPNPDQLPAGSAAPAAK